MKTVDLHVWADSHTRHKDRQAIRFLHKHGLVKWVFSVVLGGYGSHYWTTDKKAVKAFLEFQKHPRTSEEQQKFYWSFTNIRSVHRSGIGTMWGDR